MAVLAAILTTTYVHQIFWQFGLSSTIEQEKCRPPDFPEFGSYGPVRPSYDPGDSIHYFCDTDAYIGGNEKRVCLSSGFWEGDTPVCDPPAEFIGYRQSSTAPDVSTNDAGKASDGNRNTCSKTVGDRNGATWTGYLRETAREVLRFMMFLPKGDVAYEVFIETKEGKELSCGRNVKRIGLQEWEFNNCLPPNNSNAVAVKVKSLTDRPLEICEIVVHTLVDPICADPHFEVDNGRLMLSRKTAKLVCNDGYVVHDNSPKKLDCISTGVWSRRSLFCTEKEFEVEDVRRGPPNRQRPSRPGDPIISGNRPRVP